MIVKGIISALMSTHSSLSVKKNAVDLVFCDLSIQFLCRLLCRRLGILWKIMLSIVLFLPQQSICIFLLLLPESRS